MTTKYGEELQQFFCDHYCIHAVVGFDARVFEDAYVDGALLLMERCADENARKENTVNFIRVKDSMEVDDLVDTLRFRHTVEDSRQMKIVNREAYRTVAVKQDYIMQQESSRLGYLLDSPQLFVELLENSKMVPMKKLLSEFRKLLS